MYFQTIHSRQKYIRLNSN